MNATSAYFNSLTILKNVHEIFNRNYHKNFHIHPMERET